MTRPDDYSDGWDAHRRNDRDCHLCLRHDLEAVRAKVARVAALCDEAETSYDRRAPRPLVSASKLRAALDGSPL